MFGYDSYSEESYMGGYSWYKPSPKITKKRKMDSSFEDDMESIDSYDDKVRYSKKMFKKALERVEREFDWMECGYWDDAEVRENLSDDVERLNKENDQLIDDYNNDMEKKELEIQEWKNQIEDLKEHMRKMKEEFEYEKRKETNILKEELRMQDTIIESMKANRDEANKMRAKEFLENKSDFMPEKKMEYCFVEGHVWGLPKVGRRKVYARKARKKVLKLSKLL